MKLFVSHSSEDIKFVELLVDLLRNALRLPPAEIRCTSLDGYRLPGGADVNQQLRQEVAEAQVFIALISHSSLKSIYTIFEFGARWGTAKSFIPLLAPGVSVRELAAPLSNFNALASDNRPQLHQLISDAAQNLGIIAESPATYENNLRRILELASKTSPEIPDTDVSAKTLPASMPLHTVNNPEEIIRRYCVQQWPDDFQMQSHCRKQQREALGQLQTLQVEDIPNEVFAEIRRNCASQWPYDFTMRLYCERRQIEAYRELQRDDVT